MPDKRPETNKKLNWALHYALRLKIPVFPLFETDGDRCSCGDKSCSDQGKHPRTSRGVYDATTDETQIREWWTRWPNANIGGRMGKVSNTTCLDCDTQDTVELVLQYAPNAPSQRTGSGGRQFFFDHEEGLKNWRKIVGGMDIRTDNSYVVLAPSSNKNGSYKWASTGNKESLPEELRKIILEHKQKEARIVASTSRKVLDALKDSSTSWNSVKDVLNIVQDKFSEEEIIPEGTRHNRLLEIGGSLRGHGVPEEKIILSLGWINENLCDPPLEDKEFEGIVESIRKLKAEINHLIDDFEVWLESQEFKGKAGATDKKIIKTLLKEARKYGRKGLKGLDVVISRLDLKDKAGVSFQTVCASVKRMPFIVSTPDKYKITNASTITILYPNGTQVNDDGELIVVSFVRQFDNSYISYMGEYMSYQVDVHSRWGAGRLGLVKEDYLNLIIENIGVGVNFKIKDLHFINKDYNFKRRHLSDLANPNGWGLVKRVRKGVYVIPENFEETYLNYKEESGEIETEENELMKTKRLRLAFHYHLEVEKAIREGKNPNEVPVPDGFSQSEATDILQKEEEKERTRCASEERVKAAIRGELDLDQLSSEERAEVFFRKIGWPLK